MIAAAGYQQPVDARATPLNQTSLQGDLADIESDFRRVTTDQRIVVNGLLGLSASTSATTRSAGPTSTSTTRSSRPAWASAIVRSTTVDFLQQDTAWYERQLIDTQLVGEFKPTDKLSLDVRGSYANSQRDAPFGAVVRIRAHQCRGRSVRRSTSSTG